jgi:hypothetical protein
MEAVIPSDVRSSALMVTMFNSSAFSMVGNYLFQRNLSISVDKQAWHQSYTKQTKRNTVVYKTSMTSTSTIHWQNLETNPNSN